MITKKNLFEKNGGVLMIDFNEKKGFIIDMDGVMYHGNRVLEGAVDFINWLQENDKKYLFLTNSSEKTP